MASNPRPVFKHPIPGRSDGVSIASSDDIMQVWEPGDNTSTIIWNGRQITVTRLLPFRDVSQFINAVMDLCFDTEHEIAVPEAADFAIRLNVLMRYAGIMMTNDIEEQYRIVYESGLYEAVIEVINTAQLEAIRQTVQTCVLHLM